LIASRWSDEGAKRFIGSYASGYEDAQLGKDIALRVYTSQLIGAESDLVLHGGGNTSVKSPFTNILGQKIPAIFVKGSGWDLKDIEPPGLPGLDLDYLRKLRDVERLSDVDMVNELRTHMFDAGGPNPSVEALLHAFINAKFVDHSHADAIIALTNNTDSQALLEECFGEDVSYVPYVMPGFDLSKQAGDVYDRNPDKQGMVLLNHGLFTYGDTARESYERHIELVRRAEGFLEKRAKTRTFSVETPPELDPLTVLPIVRGALAIRDGDGAVRKRFVATLRTSKEIQDFVNSADLLAVAATGPLTPDHIIRTKELPLVVPVANGKPGEVSDAVAEALLKYEEAYDAYFHACSGERKADVTKLDAKPRIVLIPGIGQIAIGNNLRAAEVAADIYEHTISVKSLVSSFSTYAALPQLDLFDVEYWSLEQAKLAKQGPKALDGQVALITGGAGAIGVGIARVLKQAGAEVVITDLHGAEETANELGCFGLIHDVTSQDSTREVFRRVCSRFGGIDILVPNAGVALSTPIESLSDEDARRVMDVNFHGYLRVIREAVPLMKLQGTGGNIVIISSKNVLAPGKDFGIYSASKAAGQQLGKVAALELAEHNIRVNMIAPDAVFGTETDAPGQIRSGLWKEVGPDRAKAHDIPPEELEAFYRDRNLLHTTVSAEDVGRAVLFFATNQTPTTGATLPVDGGVPQAFPR